MDEPTEHDVAKQPPPTVLRYGRPRSLVPVVGLVLAQVPAACGIAGFGAVMLGLVKQHLGTFALGFLATVGGSMLSLGASIPFLWTRQRRAAIIVECFHACYLLVWVALIIYAAMRPPRHIPGP
jgi:hypothetical protein